MVVSGLISSLPLSGKEKVNRKWNRRDYSGSRDAVRRESLLKRAKRTTRFFFVMRLLVYSAFEIVMLLTFY